MTGRRNVAGGKEYPAGSKRKQENNQKKRARIRSFTLPALWAMAVGGYWHILSSDDGRP
jgi:predicted permease